MNSNEVLNRIQQILFELYWGGPMKVEEKQMWLEQVRVDVTDDERREDYFELPTVKEVLEQIKEAIEDETD